VLLTITIPIAEEFVQSSKLTIPKKSKEGEKFVKKVISIFKSLNTSLITNCKSLEQIVNSLASGLEQAWFLMLETSTLLNILRNGGMMTAINL